MKLLAGLLLLAPLAASATIYKWIDEEGRVVYANHEPDASARSVQVMKIPEEPITPASPTQALEQRVARLESELQAARQYAQPPVPPAPYPAAYMPPAPPTMSDYYAPTYAYPGYAYGYPAYGYPVYTYPVYGYRYPYNRYPVRVVHHGAGFVRGGVAHVAPRGGGMARR